MPASFVAEDEPPVVEMLRELVVDEPMPGKLYQVQFRDRPADLARTIIRRSANVANPTAAQVDQYMHLLAAGSYNGELYGTHSHSNTYPDRWLVPGLGRGLRAAWLTRNLDALDCLLRGEPLLCVVDRRTGTALTPHTSYGLIWCPPVELIGTELTTEPFVYDNGASTLDPPTPILEAIAA